MKEEHAMQLIDVMFDGDETDCDIIAVPEECAADIGELGQEFCRWLFEDKSHKYWRFTKKNGAYCVLETDGFAEWLNGHCRSCTECKAEIIKRHTQRDPRLKTVEF